MKILFLAPGFPAPVTREPRFAPFQDADARLLSALGHEVHRLLWRHRPLRELRRASQWADVVYSWNIGEHSFFATFLRTRLACVIGGYDFANLAEYDYGNLRTWRGRVLTKRVWRRADALLYVDPSLMDEATAAFGHPGRAQYLPTGYDPSFWTPEAPRRGNAVLTVANAPWPERVRLKGIDIFLRVARENPDLEFHVAGEMPPTLVESQTLSNVRFHGFLEAVPLRELYRQAKVYCQLSRHEGLPNALCEAMLCGCFPVGTAVNGIPRAIGDTGFLVEPNPKRVAEAIRAALASDGLGAGARNRIATLFPWERRRDELRRILQSLIEEGG